MSTLGRLLLLAWVLGPAAGWAAPAAPTGLTVQAPSNDSGLRLDLAWTASADPDVTGYAVLRGATSVGPWEVAAGSLTADATSMRDTVTSDPATTPPADAYWYRVLSLHDDAPAPEPAPEDADEAAAAERAHIDALLAACEATTAVRGEPRAVWLHTGSGHLLLLGLLIAIAGMMLYFTEAARRGREIFVRRIPGIDAIEEGVGRATEMGRPVLYVPGVDELQDIQTIASMLVLGQVAKTIAEYQADIIVSCRIPIVREVADEVVRAGFYQAGHPDAYDPSMARFISSDQFAFTAGTNGIIMREKPATNLYLGRFFAESLILAETGYINNSIQIAGTAAAAQLPFFVAACDYTLIGEELYAVSAYLSRDPRLVSSLKASDIVKVACVIAIIVGTIAASLGSDVVVELLRIAE